MLRQTVESGLRLRNRRLQRSRQPPVRLGAASTPDRPDRGGNAMGAGCVRRIPSGPFMSRFRTTPVSRNLTAGCVPGGQARKQEVKLNRVVEAVTGGVSIPVSRTRMPRSCARVMIPAIFLSIARTDTPLSPSFAPRATMRICGSSRARRRDAAGLRRRIAPTARVRDPGCAPRPRRRAPAIRW